jgi:hypothetical protein
MRANIILDDTPKIVRVACAQDAFVADVLQAQDFASNLIYIKSSPVTCLTKAATDNK